MMLNGDFFSGAFVPLADILLLREKRALLQNALLAQYEAPLISYTVNIAGPVKRFKLGDCCYAEGKRLLEDCIHRNKWEILEFRETDQPAGIECIWAVKGNALDIKRATIQIEEGHAMGRLFDIDIIDPSGQKISRQDLDLEERCCIVCGKPGSGCARSRRHSTEEIQQCTASLITGYFNNGGLGC